MDGGKVMESLEASLDFQGCTNEKTIIRQEIDIMAGP